MYPGADKPLLRPVKHDPEIHGEDGLGGVEGLPAPNDPEVLSWFASTKKGTKTRALEGMVQAITVAWNMGEGHQVTVISTGPMTNIALFVAGHPELLEAVEEFVFMGGGVGMGNRSAVAEFNIMCDREWCSALCSHLYSCDNMHSARDADRPRRASEDYHDPNQRFAHSHCNEGHTSTAAVPCSWYSR